jgi:hypothetical protein
MMPRKNNKSPIVPLIRGPVKNYYSSSEWGVNAEYRKGKLISCGMPGILNYLNGRELVECSKEEYDKLISYEVRGS